MQVSRLFSALLQLANNGNVVILRGSDPSQAFQLRLASLENKHKHFQDYRAPSFLQNKVWWLVAVHFGSILCMGNHCKFHVQSTGFAVSSEGGPQASKLYAR